MLYYIYYNIIQYFISNDLIILGLLQIPSFA